MVETSTSWERGLRRESGLSRQGAAQGHSVSGNGKHWRDAPMVGQTHIRIPRLNLFAPLRRFPGSPLEPTRALLCIVGIVVGIAGSSSAALGDVEEPSSQDLSVSDYGETISSRDIIVNLITNLLDNYHGNTSQRLHSNYSPLDAIYNDSEFLHYSTNTTTGGRDRFGSAENLGDESIPAAVWSLDASTGVHLGHLSSDFGSDLGMVVGSPQRTPDFWTSLILGNDTDRRSNATLSSSLQFQVASCGGASAENPDLAHCGISDTADNSADDPKGIKQTTGSGTTVATNNNSGAENESNTPSPPNQQSQPGAVLDLSPLTPASVNNVAAQGDPTFVSPLLYPCVDTFAFCTTARTDQPPAPIDTPGLDSLGPPGSASLGPPGSASLGPPGSDSLGPPGSDSLGPPDSQPSGPVIAN